MVKRHLAKVETAGSSPVYRSLKPQMFSGVFVVYLFSEDGKRLYLTLSVAGSGYNKKNITPDKMAEKAQSISDEINEKFDFKEGIKAGALGSDERSKNYEMGIALHKEYDLSDLPSDHEMIDDLQKMCEAYHSYLTKTTPKSGKQAETEPSKNKFPKNLIFFGAPGTGKTYRTVNQAVAICLKKPLDEINAMDRKDLNKAYRDLVDKGNITFVTFHQSYSYEDFVIGIFPKIDNGKSGEGIDEGGISYIRKDGIFKVICDAARENKETNFVLIIDEINRGNISKIFGELITLIEESKREGESEETMVTLPYMDNKDIIHFSVPNNVYIIGTMNTADRSIQHVDTALRRRFVFEEVLPDPKLFEKVNIASNGKTVNIANLLDSINRRIKRYFDREHVIGHAYLMPMLQEGLNDQRKLEILGEIFHDKLIPLLQDYFFEDYSKIQKVLGKSDDTDDSLYLIRKVKTDSYGDNDEGRDVYEVAPKGDSAYTNIETYELMAK